MSTQFIDAGVTGIDLADGKYLRALAAGPSQFVVTTNFNQLKSVTTDPAYLQPNAKQRAGNDDLETQAELHELVQRALAGNKKANVPLYRAYIEDVVQGRDGVLPPIHLWTEQHLNEVRDGNGNPYAHVSDGVFLLAIDGETQLTSHYDLQGNPATPSEIKELHRRYPLVAIIHHGQSPLVARQYFHDLNVLAVRPNTSLGLSMDTSDPLMRVVSSLAETIPQLKGNVDLSARQLRKGSSKLVTLQALRQMVVNVGKGIAGIQYGARPAPLDDVDIDDLEEVARAWISFYFETFAPHIVDRERYLASSGTVLAAVGAMGNQILRTPADEREYLQVKLARQLKDVDWTKGDHWTGIAGAPTPKGQFSVKGTKETAYAVFNALTDPTTAGYQRIRQSPSAPHNEAF